MNIETIRNTALCRYDSKEGLYIVESPLLGICSGIAEQKEEAWESFNVLLQAMYVEYLEGKRVWTYHRKKTVKRGRPPKGGVKINTQVNETTKKVISKLAARFHCSYGEAIDYLSGYFMATPRVEEQPALEAKYKAASVKRAKTTSTRKAVSSTKKTKRAR